MSDQPEALRLADRLEGRWALHPEMQEAAAELRRQHDEIEQLKAERDALMAAAEKGTEYVLAQINQDLKAERDAAVKALRFLFDHGAYLTERVPDDLKAAIDAARGE